MNTAKSPQGGKDIIQASANTFYDGVTLADLKDFKAKYPLNSRVVKGPDGQLKEEVYRAGTPDGSLPPGLYAMYLKKANEELAKAQAVADPKQAQVIGDLIRFYQTGEFSDWLKFGADWVQNNPTVDFDNGFIEVYRDARGAKGSSQSFVTVTDKPLTDNGKLAENAAYFEQKAPWDAQYKKTQLHAADGEGRRDADRNRRLPRHHHWRQSAQRERNSREIRQQELSVHRQHARAERGRRHQVAGGIRRHAGSRSSAARSTARKPKT